MIFGLVIPIDYMWSSIKLGGVLRQESRLVQAQKSMIRLAGGQCAASLFGELTRRETGSTGRKAPFPETIPIRPAKKGSGAGGRGDTGG